MAKIWCCRRFQQAEIFKIKPTRKQIFQEFVLYVSSCSCCKQPVLEILRADYNENILMPVRLNSKNIPDFIKKMNVIREFKQTFVRKNKISKFILNYNEFGKIKKCSKNFSNINLGKIETDPVINLKTYKQFRESLKLS